VDSLNPQRSIGSTLAEPIVIHRLRPRNQVRDRVAVVIPSGPSV